MSIGDQIAASVAKGLAVGIERHKNEAEQAIVAWEQALEEAHNAAGDLATFEARKPMVERQALEALMKEEADPVTGKPLSLTRAKELLDTVPEYRAYRQERNEKEGLRHYLLAKASVAERRADLSIAYLHVLGKALS